MRPPGIQCFAISQKNLKPTLDVTGTGDPRLGGHRESTT